MASKDQSVDRVARFQSFLKSFRDARENVSVLKPLLRTAIDAGEFGLAKDICEKIFESNPNHRGLDITRIEIAAALTHVRADQNTLVSNLERFTIQYDLSAADWLQVSTVFDRLHRSDLSLKAIKSAQTAGLDPVIASRRIAYACYFRRELRSAGKVLRKLLDEPGLQWPQMREFADLAYKVGHKELALKFARRMQDAFPGDIRSIVTLALFQARTGNRLLAVDLIRPHIAEIDESPRGQVVDDTREILSGFVQLGIKADLPVQTEGVPLSFGHLVSMFDASDYNKPSSKGALWWAIKWARRLKNAS